MRLQVLTTAFLLAAAAEAGQEPDWIARLRAAIERAASENPEVVSMEARIAASRQRVDQATALPDPEIEVGLKDVPVAHPSLTHDDFTMEVVGAQQRFPGFGKLSAEKRAAEAELEGLRAEHTRHVVEIAADVADSFFRLAELDRRIAIAEETKQRLSDAVVAARERYRVGRGAQADVLRADLERTAIEDRLASLRAARRSEAARWNSLQNASAKADVPAVGIPPDFESRIWSIPSPSEEDQAWQAEKASPAVAAALAGVRRAEDRLEQARLERRPDWTLMGYYAHRVSFEDLAGISFSFSLPWAHPRRLDERRAEREAELEAAKADLAAVRNALRRDLDQAYAELAKNRSQARFYRESILPQAEINHRAAREAYAVGSIDFLTYVRAATDLDGYQAELAEREMGIGRSIAMLQKASGLALIQGTPGPGGNHVEK